MSSRTTQWVLELIDSITAPLRSVQGAADAASGAVEGLDGNVDGLSHSGGGLSSLAAQVGAAAFAFNQVSDSIGKFNQKFQDTITPGISFQSQMAELSAITGQGGDELNRLGDRARELAKEFGGDASAQLESFKGIIGKFGPDIAGSDAAMEGMGRNVAVLSKLMGGDAVASMDALTTSMLQYGVDLTDPAGATAEMTRMMNVMVAAGNEGSSEVSDTAAALKQAGLSAKNAGVGFEEVNASLQALATGSLVGSEAGVGLRNVLLKMAGEDVIPKNAREKMKALGVDFQKVSDTAVPFTERLRELKKIQGDATLTSEIFGIANVNAATVLLDTIDMQDDLKGKITGTNAAMEGAGIIMDTYAEKQSRTNAWINDLKISFFNATESIAPFIGIAGDAMQGLTDMGGAVWSLSILFKKDLWTGIGSAIGAMGSWISTNIFAKTATLATTAAQWLFNAALWASPVTWVVAGVAAFTGAMVLLWNRCEGFRAVLYGLWEVIKGFADIIKNYVIDRIKGFLSGIGALGEALVKLFKGDFQGAFESAKEGISGIVGVEARMNAYNGAKKLGEAYAKGAADGREAFQKSKQEGGAMFPPVKGETVTTGREKADIKVGEVVLTDKEKEAVKRIGKTPLKELSGNKTKKDGSSSGSSSGGSSSSGGKSIAMNVTLNMSNYGVNDADKLAEQVVRKINDRLSDALAIA
jgi:TP901 family phage tail tape measure protein